MTVKHMDGIFNKLNQYGLHDTRINNIMVEGENIILVFNEGVYRLSDSGRETDLTGARKLIITVAVTKNADIEDYLTVNKLFRKKREELSLKQLLKLVDEYSFDVFSMYFSAFNNEMLIVGDIWKFGAELYISDIVDAEYIVD